MNGNSEAKPSPLAGEGGVRRCRAPGEGKATHLSRLGKTRQLRQNLTDAEHALWRILRNRQFAGVKFRRQVSIGPYIADFVCYDERLVIEADGGQHNESKTDNLRDAWFAANGFRVLRFLEQRDSEKCGRRRCCDSDGARAKRPSPGPFRATLSRKGERVS
jgi:very-short-patch-repair endonuclease